MPDVSIGVQGILKVIVYRYEIPGFDFDLAFISKVVCNWISKGWSQNCVSVCLCIGSLALSGTLVICAGNVVQMSFKTEMWNVLLNLKNQTNSSCLHWKLVHAKSLTCSSIPLN